MDHLARRQALLARLANDDLEGMVVNRPIHVRYLSGFSGSNGALLVTGDGTWLFTDGRYLTQAQAETSDLEIVNDRAVVPAAVRQAAQRKLRRLAFEAEWTPQAQWRGLADSGGAELVPVANLVEDLRLIKDDHELAAIEKACEVTDSALSQLVAEGLLGRSELDIAGRLEHLFRVHGAEDRAFESIVAAGEHSAVPHHQPTQRLVAPGDLVKIDCGARWLGYHADCTRTFVAGPAADWQREVFEVVKAAQAVGRAALVAGADPMAVDRAARNVVEAAGYGPEFVHPLGHAVGLEIHERPFLGRSEGILRPRMPVTVEPGVYLAGRGGVRIEDTVLITETGQRSLTNLTRELVEL